MDALLRSILHGTAGVAGEPFLDGLVRHLGESVEASHAFLAVAESGSLRALATWSRSGRALAVTRPLAGTPCGLAAQGTVAHYPRGVRTVFPGDPLLADAGADGYLGLPLLDRAGAVLGILAVLHGTATADAERLRCVVEIFAARACAELQNERTLELLRGSERRYRDLFEEAPIAYVHEDTDTRFVSANRAAIELLGLHPDRVRGTVGRSLLAPTSETQGRIDDAFADIQQGKERSRIEIELRRQDDGRPVFAQFWSRPEPDGKHTRTMLIDITDRVLAERERNRLRQQNSYLQEEIKASHDFDEIVGRAPALLQALADVKRVAPTDSTVLVLGETGCGKELIARAIHDCSPRRGRPMIKLNCAALPTGLIESELFGHEKGAFTGALEKRIGRFALADGGTIFLDEVGELPADVQVRLLRVLQEHEFEPVGSPRTVKVDVRVIAATNRDLERAIADGEFRLDLFYRLNVFPIRIPPLRERREDIPLLAHYFVRRYAGKLGKRIDAIDPATLERLVDYAWPGNIRELENVVERAVILSTDGVLAVDPAVLRGPSSVRGDDSAAVHEREHVVRVLDQTRWVIEGERGAAKVLGLHPNTLRSRMKKLGIVRRRS